MTVTGFITAIVVGLIIGALGRLVVPGKQKIGLLLTLLVGVVAALIGTFIAQAVGVGTDGFSFLELAIQVLVAAVGVAIVAGAVGRGRSRV